MNNPTGDVPLLPVFKFQGNRERTTQTLLAAISHLSPVPSIFTFPQVYTVSVPGNMEMTPVG